MICRRCKTDVPDGLEECPVCGTEFAASRNRKRADNVLSVSLFSDAWVMLMFFINGFLFATVSHVPYDPSWGLFIAWGEVHRKYPGLSLVSLIFGLLLAVIAVLSAVALYLIVKRSSRQGVYLMAAIHTASVLWTVLYTVMCYMVTGAPSQFFLFSVIQCAIYVVVAVIPTVYLFRTPNLY